MTDSPPSQSSNPSHQQQSQRLSFPNLFLEILEPLAASICIFALVDLRRVVQSKQSTRESVSGNIFQLPLPGPDIVEIFHRNKELLKSTVKANEYDTLQLLVGPDFRQKNHFQAVDGVTLHYFGDDRAEEECVYSINTSEARKRILVVFRGSITMNDWITDAKLIAGDVENPLYDTNDTSKDAQPEFLAIHVGFRDYLYGRKTKEAKRKIDVILEQVQALMETYPDYCLYVTGHSLGGALALLFALEASARFATKDKPPVTSITIANPRVGDVHFRKAIRLLERQKRLRCLTVHNDFDLVPNVPNRLCRGDFCRPNNFRQPGMELALAKNSFRTNYQGDTKWGEEFQQEFRRFMILIFCFVRMAEQHNYRTYLDRLTSQKIELSKIHLNDLYKQIGINYDE